MYWTLLLSYTLYNLTDLGAKTQLTLIKILEEYLKISIFRKNSVVVTRDFYIDFLAETRLKQLSLDTIKSNRFDFLSSDCAKFLKNLDQVSIISSLRNSPMNKLNYFVSESLTILPLSYVLLKKNHAQMEKV